MDSHPGGSAGEQELDNTFLIQAMHACRDAYSPHHRENVYRELLQSTLLIPVQPRAGAEPGNGVAGSEHEDVGLLMTRHPETGEPVILAFTDHATMSEYHVPDNRCSGISASRLFERLSPDTAPSLIICAPDASLAISHPEILLLAAGRIPPPQVTGTPSATPRPARISFKALDTDLPSSIHSEFSTLLAHAADISAVYVFLMREDEQAPGFAAAVLFSELPDERTTRPLLDNLARCITQHLPVETPLTLLSLDEHDEFACDLGLALLPYYSRGEGAGSMLN